MPAIRTETHGPVGVITIDRRSRFNSLDVTTARELRAAGLRFSRDPAIRCVVLRGAGGVFCSGADLKYVRERGNAADFGYLQPDGAGPPGGGRRRGKNNKLPTCQHTHPTH